MFSRYWNWFDLVVILSGIAEEVLSGVAWYVKVNFIDHLSTLICCWWGGMLGFACMYVGRRVGR